MAELKELSEIQVFKTVLYYCLFIIVLPIICFFSSKMLVFDAIMDFNSIASNVYAAAVAILVLHIALGAFIYRTYFDTQVITPSKTD